MRSLSLHILKTVAIKDCVFPSGIAFLREGQYAEAVVFKGRLHVTGKELEDVYREIPQGKLETTFSTDDLEWIWDHLILDGPWEQLLERTKGER